MHDVLQIFVLTTKTRQRITQEQIKHKHVNQFSNRTPLYQQPDGTLKTLGLL